ncbi:hypothetical protein [Rhizobium sp. G21]|uniref:hypothetical protein n=1 Tax=Rhizobium sp. G21 TaxID=2758439 RepID=UPI0016040BEC|nr:hypothetical protein [Rhizobium sp. G21]MBB1249319.1 hypothetical protein [Rhizobium sp. G21]
MIRPPRADGVYKDRDLDCQEALEVLFLDLVREADTAFLDLQPIRARLIEAGLAAADGVRRISIPRSRNSCAVMP